MGNDWTSTIDAMRAALETRDQLIRQLLADIVALRAEIKKMMEAEHGA